MTRAVLIFSCLGLFSACGSSQNTRMELRSSEQVQIAELLGCTDYDIEEADRGAPGATTRTYDAACVDGSRSGTIVCQDGGGCQLN